MTKELKNRILENKVLTHDERMEIIKALEQQPCETAIDKKEVFNILRRNYRVQSVSVDGYCVPANYREDIYDEIKSLPPVTPTHGTCKECNLWCKDKAIDGACFCSSFHTYTGYEFYCADFEKRGNKVGWSSLENVREKVERGNEND